MRINKKKFIYLISPNKIYSSFYNDLEEVLKSKKVSFFQLRLKNMAFKRKLIIGRKIKKICKKYNAKFIKTKSIHKNGTERIAEAVKKINVKENDIIIDVQGDEPLVNPKHIDIVIKFFISNK